MWDWKTISAIASFCIALGGSTVLDHFEQTTLGLVSGILFIIIGIGLACWSFIGRRKTSIVNITTESIRKDINRQLTRRYLMHFIPIIIVAIGLVVGIQFYFGSMNQQPVKSTARPMLAIDTEITPSNIFDDQQEADINIIFHVINSGDEPAYQTWFRFICSPINQPDKLSTDDDKYQQNPIYKGTTNQISTNIHISPIIKINNQVIIITRSSLKYSDVSNGEGKWYYVTYWWALTADFSTQSINMIAVDPDIIKIYEPYFNNAFPDKWE